MMFNLNKKNNICSSNILGYLTVHIYFGCHVGRVYTKATENSSGAGRTMGREGGGRKKPTLARARPLVNDQLCSPARAHARTQAGGGLIFLLLCLSSPPPPPPPVFCRCTGDQAGRRRRRIKRERHRDVERNKKE